jgi:hypothetical protein
MRRRPLRLITAVLVMLVAVSPAGYADTSPEAARLFRTLDTNADNVLDEGELTAALTPSLLRVAELQHLPDPDVLVRRVVNAALNAIGRDDVRLVNFDAFLAYRLDPPFALSLRALLLQQDVAGSPQGGTGSSWWQWIQVRQSAIDEQSYGNPARLSYASRDIADESSANNPVSQWKIDGAVILNSQRDVHALGWALTPIVAYEAHVDSDKEPADRIIHRAGVLGSLTPTSGAIESHYLFATFDYTTDRRYDAQVFGATVEYSPTIAGLAIDRFTPGPEVRFRWRPYVGLQYGHVANAGALTGLDHDYTDITLRVTPELRLFKRVVLGPLLEWAQQLRGDKAFHGYYEWSGRVILIESDQGEASVELSYDVGRQSPAFKKTGVFSVAFAVKF